MKTFLTYTGLFAFAIFALALSQEHAHAGAAAATDLMAGGMGLSGLGFFAIGELKKVLELPHLDAEEGLFFQRELEYVKTAAYDKKYANYKARQLIPMSSEVPNWAETIVYDIYDQVGMAKLITGYSDDIPMVDVKGLQVVNPIKSMGVAYGYSIQEIRKSKGTGKRLDQRLANAAKRACLQLENKLALLGDANVGFLGFLNHPNVPTVTLPNDGTGSSILWANKTAKQILRDLNLLANKVSEQTLGVEIPNTMLLPMTAFNYLAATTWSDNNDGKSLLKQFLDNQQYIKNIEWMSELETAGAGGTRRMMVYRKDPEAVTMEVPQDFEQFDPQPRNLRFVVPCHQRFGGVLFYYPLSAAYADGF